MSYLLLGALLAGQPLQGHEGQVFAAAFSPDGKTLATGGEDRVVILWDLGAGKERLRLLGHLGAVWGVAFASADTVITRSRTELPVKEFLAASPEERAAGLRAELIVWDAATGKQRFRFEDRGSGGTGLAVSPNGRTVAAAWGPNGTWVRLWDVRTGRECCTLELPDPTSAVWQLAFGTDGAALAVVTNRNVLQLWNVGTRKSLWTSPHPCHGWASFNPEGTLVTTTDESQVCRLLDTATGKVVREGKLGGSARFLDGKVLGAAGPGLLAFHDAETFKALGSVQVAAKAGMNLAVSADRKRVAVVGTDGAVEVRDVPKLP